jgi:hypothetical protein
MLMVLMVFLMYRLQPILPTTFTVTGSDTHRSKDATAQLPVGVFAAMVTFPSVITKIVP